MRATPQTELVGTFVTLTLEEAYVLSDEIHALAPHLNGDTHIWRLVTELDRVLADDQ